MRSKSSDSRRLVAAYILGGFLATSVVVGALTVLMIDSGSGQTGSAHIGTATGSTNGVQPDNRLGTKLEEAVDVPLALAIQRADCRVRLKLPDEGHQHLAPNEPEPKYATIPPTSGPHVEGPYQQADGAYRETPRGTSVVHSLEHGRLAIQYDPDLAETDQLELIGLYDTMYGGALIFPNARMPFAVSATTWRNLLSCRHYQGQSTLDAIRAFGKATWGRFGGEPVNTFKTGAPTPFEPLNP